MVSLWGGKAGVNHVLDTCVALLRVHNHVHVRGQNKIKLKKMRGSITPPAGPPRAPVRAVPAGAPSCTDYSTARAARRSQLALRGVLRAVQGDFGAPPKRFPRL